MNDDELGLAVIASVIFGIAAGSYTEGVSIGFLVASGLCVLVALFSAATRNRQECEEDR